jgi:hypothetical protein
MSVLELYRNKNSSFNRDIEAGAIQFEVWLLSRLNQLLEPELLPAPEALPSTVELRPTASPVTQQ